MIQTLEAIIDETGKITLSEEIRLKEERRAIVIILDEEPKIFADAKTSPDVKPNNDWIQNSFGEFSKV
jgi:hypothetical protein